MAHPTHVRRAIHDRELRFLFGSDHLDGLDVHSLDDGVETVENFNPRSFRRLSDEDMEAITSEANATAKAVRYRISPDSLS